MADAVGLYLGARSLHLVELAGSFSKPRITKVAHVDVDAALLSDAQAAQTLSQPLQRLLQQARLTSSNVQTGIAAEAVIIRYFQMPKLPQRDRPTAIRFEAKKYLPFKLEELVTDFHVVILKSDPAVMRVMFYAVKRDLIAQYLQLIKEAGLRPLSLETSLGSLVRVLRRNRQLESGKTITLLSIDQGTASIALVRDEIVYLARNVTVVPAAGSSDIAPEELAGLESGERPAGPSAPPLTIQEALLNETVVSIDYYRRRFAGEPAVVKVVVSGDDVSAAWLSELSQTLELPVQTLAAGQGLRGGEALTGNAAVAFGLALRGLDPAQKVTNLLPTALTPRRPDILSRVGVEVGIAALLLGGLYVAKGHPVQQLAAQVAAFPPPQAVGELSPNDLTAATLQQQLGEVRGELQFLQSFRQASPPIAITLTELATLTPEAVWLRRLLFEETTLAASPTAPISSQQQLTIAGSAYHPDTTQELTIVNGYAQRLNDQTAVSRQFGRLDLVNAQRRLLNSTVDVTDFQLANDRRETR